MEESKTSINISLKRAISKAVDDEESDTPSLSSSSSSSLPSSSSNRDSKKIIIITGGSDIVNTTVAEGLARQCSVGFIKADALLAHIDPNFLDLPNFEARLRHLSTSIESLSNQVMQHFQSQGVRHSSVLVIACDLKSWRTRLQIARLRRTLPYENVKTRIWYLKCDYNRDFDKYIGKLRCYVNSKGKEYVVPTKKIWRHTLWEEGALVKMPRVVLFNAARNLDQLMEELEAEMKLLIAEV